MQVTSFGEQYFLKKLMVKDTTVHMPVVNSKILNNISYKETELYKDEILD